MNLTQAIVSKLGTKPEPFGWSDISSFLLVFFVIASLAGIEFLIGQAVRRMVKSAWRSISSEYDRANRKNRNGN
jgi:hypothetical protein